MTHAWRGLMRCFRAPRSECGVNLLGCDKRMPCGCSKKGASGLVRIGERMSAPPEEWGPAWWRTLHCLAAKLGGSGSALQDAEEGRTFEFLITHLCDVLPCRECQGHCRDYLGVNRPAGWSELRGGALRAAAVGWLVDFHNAVNVRLGKEAVGVEEAAAMYEGCQLLKCEVDLLMETAVFGTKMLWVKMDNWKRWLRSLHQLRLLLGAAIVVAGS